MRCTCCTASSSSISRTSKSIFAPTAPSTVCCSPVERCTSKPRFTSRSITLSICCSVAFGCMAMIIVSASVLLVHFHVELGLAGRGDLLATHLLLLKLSHHVDDALVHMLHFGVGQRPPVGLLHVLDDAFLPLRLR